jgi:hypothetical protein
VAVRFEPMVEMDLVQVRRDDFFANLMRFDAKERHAKSRERCDQRLGDFVRVRGAVFVARFHLAQRSGDNQQAVGKCAQAAQARDEDRTFDSEEAGYNNADRNNLGSNQL